MPPPPGLIVRKKICSSLLGLSRQEPMPEAQVLRVGADRHSPRRGAKETVDRTRSSASSVASMASRYGRAEQPQTCPFVRFTSDLACAGQTSLGSTSLR